MLFVVPISDTHLITHDGVSQVGSLHCTIEWFAEHCGVDFTVTYWTPDVYANRYARTNYQAHLKTAGKDTLENAPVSEWKRRGQL